VLVHCSDGWDRTSQLTALAQLLLDPFFRTFDGFKVLVEKEWLAFGHKFDERMHDPASDETAAVFIQFLDCTFQLLDQFPTAFEFSPSYLAAIATHCGSGWFGTFLCGSEFERKRHGLKTSSVSIWAHLDAHRADLANLSYQPTALTLSPICAMKRMRVWASFYLQYDEVYFRQQHHTLAESNFAHERERGYKRSHLRDNGKESSKDKDAQPNVLAW
jgi:hypothetical protein